MAQSEQNISWKWKHAIMWVLNITPDSFYDGGKFIHKENAIAQVHKMIEEWADIIDIGWQSTRPGYEKISARDELSRIEPIVQYIRDVFPHIPLSIDSFYAEVIQHLSKYKINIINSVAWWEINNEMIDSIISSWWIYVITSHENEIENMMNSLENQIKHLKKYWINDIIIDPWFWFGKSREQNYEILGNIRKLQKFNMPILAWISRKSMIYKTLNITPEESLNGTTALNTIALINGAYILRVHDVKEAKETIKLFETYEQHFWGI